MKIIEFNGFKACIQKARRLEDNGCVHGLPTGTPIEVYPVDAFKHPLSNWMTGAGNYVVPVKEDWGLWFDWTMNDTLNTAVMPTVKGMNPITGRKTEGYALERYQTKCPVHNVEFKDGNFCEECGYKWPHQNYVCSPNTLWWDGFRAPDGTVRQFFFTADMMKSIPERVIGAKETVPAFGFCFYQPKVPRPRPVMTTARGCDVSLDNMMLQFQETKTHASLLDQLANKHLGSLSKIADLDPVEGWAHVNTFYTASGYTPPGSYTSNLVSDTMSSPKLFADKPSGDIANLLQALSNGQTASKTAQSSSGISGQSCLRTKISLPTPKVNAEVGIGAGAKIAQDLRLDTLALEDWSEEPSAVMRLYFIFDEQFADLSSKGMRDLVGNKDGFMAGLPVG